MSTYFSIKKAKKEPEGQTHFKTSQFEMRPGYSQKVN